MFKKITGLLILLSFLLIKGAPLFAAGQHTQNAVVCCTDQATDDTSDAEKENKQLETADEDFGSQPVLEPASLTISKKAGHIIVPDIPAPYLSLPYPPPNSWS
ncbi:hypothetical protein ABIE26_001137 [Pedobacter africanus]|uniref:Uncharacterized protein n=1 Tax=Pedobacter africanus TaxID=151894 RepID=A0ACC6KT48_9SPHI|nr:hypothetical protein [Pedobacter africanus]MDR6782375.1 hypothetical protein [Pedobacter africanus]